MIKKPGTPDWAYWLQDASNSPTIDFISRAFLIAFMAYFLQLFLFNALYEYALLPDWLARYSCLLNGNFPMCDSGSPVGGHP